MKLRKTHTILKWTILLLVSISISFSTLHSHHNIEWNHTIDHHNSEHCITHNTNFCPICGYLFSANFVDHPPQILVKRPVGFVAILSNSQLIDPFAGERDGRSPPFMI